MKRLNRLVDIVTIVAIVGFVAIPLFGTESYSPTLDRFAPGSVPIQAYRIDGKAETGCFSKERNRVLEVFRKGKPKTQADIYAYEIIRGRFTAAEEFYGEQIRNEGDAQTRAFAEFNLMVIFASRAIDAYAKLDYDEGSHLAKLAMDYSDSVRNWCERDRSLWYIRLQLQRLLKDYRGESESLKRLVELEWQETGFLRLAAYRYIDLEQSNAALKVLQEIRTRSGMTPADWELMAMAYSKKELYPECINACDTVLAYDQFNHNCLRLKAEALYSSDSYVEAIPIFTLLTERKPQDRWNWYWLGDAHRELGEYDDAVAAFRKGLEVNPKWAACYRALAMCAEEVEDFSTAISLADTAVALDSTNALNYSILGSAQLGAKMFEAALVSYQKLVKLDPGNTVFQKGLAMCYWGLGMKKEMAEVLETVLTIKPDDESTIEYLARHYYEEKDYRRSLEHYSKMVDFNPNAIEYLYQQSTIYYFLGEYEESLEACEKALLVDPTRPDVQQQRELVLEKLGRVE